MNNKRFPLLALLTLGLAGNSHASELKPLSPEVALSVQGFSQRSPVALSPDGRLAAYVESLVFSSGYAPLHQREKLIPEGVVQIIVDLTERPKRLYAGETTPVGVDFTKSWISGIQQRWIVIEAQQGATMMVIQFDPGTGQLATRSAPRPVPLIDEILVRVRAAALDVG